MIYNQFDLIEGCRNGLEVSLRMGSLMDFIQWIQEKNGWENNKILVLKGFYFLI